MCSEKPTRVLVIAPHPDDEVIGCGGTLLRHRSLGDEIHWLIVTGMNATDGFTNTQRAQRNAEIGKVREQLGFASVTELDLPPARLDAMPLADITRAFATVIEEVEPAILYLPFGGDAHSDHLVTYSAGAACSKWFRNPSIRHVLCYETISETDAALPGLRSPFVPNYFVDISTWLDEKVRIALTYESEFGPFPFPRSRQAIEALAAVRGSAVGFSGAEAFMSIRERVA